MNFPSPLCFLLTLTFATHAFGEADVQRIREVEAARGNGKVLPLADIVRDVAGAACTETLPRVFECTQRVVVNGVEDADIRGAGARLRFLDSRPGKGGLILNGAARVRLSDFTVEWAGGGVRDAVPAGGIPVQSFGGVEKCPGGGALLLDRPITGDLPVRAVSVWDPQIGWPWKLGGTPADEIYLNAQTIVPFQRGRSACLPLLGRLSGQAHVLVRHLMYANNAFDCEDCTNVTVTHVTVHSGPGMAFVFNRGRDVSLVENTVAPACAPQCTAPEPSVAADAAHFGGTGGNILVERNDFSGQGDDGINVAALLVSGRVMATGPKGVAFQVDDRSKGSVHLLEKGHAVVAYNAALQPLGTLQVADLDIGAMTVWLSKVPHNQDSLLLSPVDRIPENVYIHVNHLHDNRARGILMSGGVGSIVGNIIERVTMNAVLLEGDSKQWLEGPGPHHVLIANNRIADVNHHPTSALYPSAISAAVDGDPQIPRDTAGPIHDVVIRDNLFSSGIGNPLVPVSVTPGMTTSR